MSATNVSPKMSRVDEVTTSPIKVTGLRKIMMQRTQSMNSKRYLVESERKVLIRCSAPLIPEGETVKNAGIMYLK
jgi:hypothetical protein